MERLLQLLKENARASSEQLAVMLNTTKEEVEKSIADYEKKALLKAIRR